VKDLVSEAVEKARREGKPALIDFTAPWCSACVAQDSIIDRVQETLKDASVTRIDVEDHPKVAEDYDILSLPSILLFAPDGQLVWRSAGRVVPAHEIIRIVNMVKLEGNRVKPRGDAAVGETPSDSV